jgi:predicted ArsR family transcriptional regulator
VTIALAALAHPARLPILLALEHRPQTAQDLDERLEWKPHQIKFSLQQLRDAGLVEIVDTRHTGTSITANVYGVRRRGWRKVLRTLAEQTGAT